MFVSFSFPDFQKVLRPKMSETTALGAAFAAGLAVGMWKDTDELSKTWALGRDYKSTMAPEMREKVRYAYVCVLPKVVLLIVVGDIRCTIRSEKPNNYRCVGTVPFVALGLRRYVVVSRRHQPTNPVPTPCAPPLRYSLRCRLSRRPPLIVALPTSDNMPCFARPWSRSSFGTGSVRCSGPSAGRSKRGPRKRTLCRRPRQM